ncbi:class I SAM-dependent methyltransferase [Kitasatospora sp. CM 4170]|uniref:Class I SAM-dependent methyltransferase n=1 Tax=Kitasatospora aburaviensis TaxID=67265 RepID=A0ABW1F956_9ACTN|nr:class I SAM-dependent methyltransferase [Kitasatospora sp. CM 4170]WNM47128.1 class I SAM-dependent methyltransferase [Kitasatospora sp. CM 4170]
MAAPAAPPAPAALSALAESAAPAAPPAPDLAGVLVTSRPLDEYCGLFGLSRAALAAVPGPVLDCPAGAAGLAAEARALGCHVIATDPAYALPVPEVAARALAARTAMAAAMAARPALYPLPQHRPYDRYLRSWDRARRLFTADTEHHPEQYVAAALPRLPFADGTFALTLSGYLVFAYPELFDPDRQVAALAELVRVTRPDGEVRVHPLHDASGRRCPHLAGVRHALGERRIASEVEVFARAEDGRSRRVLVLRAADHRRRAGGSG